MQHMNTLTISSLLCSFTALAFAIVISAKSLRDKHYRWFAILCSALAIWNLSFFFSRIFYSELIERFHLFITMILGPATIYFFWQYIEKEKLPIKIEKRLTVFILSGCVLSTTLLLPSNSLDWSMHAANLYAVASVLYAFYLLSRTLTYSQLGRQGRRKRISFIAAGLITLTMLISDRLSEMGLPLPAVGNLFLVFYIYFIYQTITKQKVLDLEDLTAKALLFFVLAAMLTLIYAILVAWVEGIALFFFNTFVASFVILILFEPIKSLIERGISQFFLKGRLKIENQLDGLKRSLLETSDLRDLAHHVLVGLKNIFQATQAHFFLLDREEIKFNLIQSLEIDPAKTKISEMMISHDFVKYLAGRNMKPSSAYFIHREIEEGAGLIRERLKNTFSLFQSLNAEVAFPFALDGKMLGFCTFINDRADEPYPSKDLELLIPLSGQIALSLKNLEIYERIRERDRLATVGEMAAGLAHEIRNPLGAIKGAAQYLMPTQENTQQNEFLRIIVNEVDRLNKIVSQFLNYAKPLSQNLTETDLSELLQSTLQIISRDLPDNVHLTYQSRSYFAVVDPSLIQQVFLNIILNAIQAMPDGGELKISMRNIKKSVEMIFEDTGIGISEENLKKIFIPFFTTREGGTGLGLAISHKIVRAHQGNFHLESELRKGTKLIMTLPCKKS